MTDDAPSPPTTGSFEDLTHEKLERMRREITGRSGSTDRGRNRNAPVDPKDLAEVREDILRGRDREHFDKWRRVMEYHGFVFLTASQLNRHPLIGPKKTPVRIGAIHGASELALEQDGTIYALVPHETPQWRRFGRFAEAFTTDDLMTLFGDVPERFDSWIRDHTLKRYMRQQGIVIPDLQIRPAKVAAARRRARGKGIVVAGGRYSKR